MVARWWPAVYAVAFLAIGGILATGEGLVTAPRYGILLGLALATAAVLMVFTRRPRWFMVGVAIGMFGFLVRCWDLILDSDAHWQQRTLGAILYALTALGLALATVFTGRAGRVRDHSK